MKANCMECWYGGCGIGNQCKASCSCEEREDRFVEYDELFKRDRYMVKTDVDYDIDCQYFIPNIENDDMELEPVTTFELTVKCPHCGHSQTEYDKSGEGNELIECDECEKKFGVHWCIY